ITKDRLGSFICEKAGPAGGPRILLAGHLDEVGFMVKSITKEGFVRFLGLGGWWGHVVLGQRLIIRTRKGDVLGVVGSKPPSETLRALKAAAHPNTVIAAATAQEEVGLRGAQTTAHKVAPDVAFALDVGIAHDIPGTEGDEKLGGGPLVVIYDATVIPNRRLH